MTQSAIFTATEIKNWSVQTEIKKGIWIPARPIRCLGFFRRFKIAYYVFVGRYDALNWQDE